MKTGLAAQSTAIFSGTQTADTSSSEENASEDLPKPDSVIQVPSINSEVEVDSGRASSAVLNTGKSTSQSSVVSSLPKTPEIEKTAQAKRMPWEQQTAEKDSDSSGVETVDSSAKNPLPWGQQSSAQSQSDDVLNETVISTTTTSSESKIRRVIIDPVTGLYIETSLSGVNNPARGSGNMSFENRQEDLLEWPFWEMAGRIGLTVAKDSYNGSVAWDQNGEAIDFRFRGPLGIGGIRIHGELDQEVRVKTTTGQDFTVEDFETEMQARMGWSIPINSLRYWVLGIVDPEVDADVVLNDEDLLDELVQGDWKIIYERYQEVDGVQLPKKFTITGPDTRIKMIANDWTIPGSE